MRRFGFGMCNGAADDYAGPITVCSGDRELSLRSGTTMNAALAGAKRHAGVFGTTIIRQAKTSTQISPPARTVGKP